MKWGGGTFDEIYADATRNIAELPAGHEARIRKHMAISYKRFTNKRVFPDQMSIYRAMSQTEFVKSCAKRETL